MIAELTTGNWITICAVIIAAIAGIIVPFILHYLPKKRNGKKDSAMAPGRSQNGAATTTLTPRISTKLPSTSPDLFGREEQLNTLDNAWQDDQTNILSLVAFGGVGKTALVNHWLNHNMAPDNYRSAQRVLGWSFYSQGAAEGKQASADQFIDSALRFFDDPDPTAGSPWDKGLRLAEFIRQGKTLLILDGLEPLQNPHDKCIKDPALTALLRSLAPQNPGLAILTTRLDIDDLKDFSDTSVKTVNLEDLSQQAGIQLLKNLGVTGTDKELKEVVSEYNGHALALTLLGSYLKVVYKGDIHKRDRIPRLTDEQKQGAHAHRVMKSYEKWFKAKPELNILYILGLFDRPADTGPIDALKADPPIKGLTSELINLSDADWQFAIHHLREVCLLAPEDKANPGTLDAHPLVREYFGDKLQATNPKAWKQAHNRLYEYYKSTAKELPETIEEMTPLYLAVTHGCNAGHYQQVFDEVYMRRIQRGNEYFNWKKLGAFGADLAALAGFFQTLWHQPVADLTDADKSFILNAAGFRLRALGRLNEAAKPMKAGLQMHISQKDWVNAARATGNLSELYLTLGDFSNALDYAHQSVDLADRGDYIFFRIVMRADLADTLHQTGKLPEAEDLFLEAERIQKEDQPYFPLLYSVQGFQYCDLLLNQGKYEEVQKLAEKALEIVLAGSQNLLDIALNHLSLGRAYLLQAQTEETGDFTGAADHLDEAVVGLRKAGEQRFIPLGLLARAELYRVTCDFNSAQRDLNEAFALADRCKMKLFESDCHLEYARLYLAQKQKDKARESFTKAKKLIDDIGYHRRDPELHDLQQKLT